jgi:hypothetical protein
MSPQTLKTISSLKPFNSNNKAISTLGAALKETQVVVETLDSVEIPYRLGDLYQE